MHKGKRPPIRKCVLVQTAHPLVRVTSADTCVAHGVWGHGYDVKALQFGKQGKIGESPPQWKFARLQTCWAGWTRQKKWNTSSMLSCKQNNKTSQSKPTWLRARKHTSTWSPTKKFYSFILCDVFIQHWQRNINIYFLGLSHATKRVFTNGFHKIPPRQLFLFSHQWNNKWTTSLRSHR